MLCENIHISRRSKNENPFDKVLKHFKFVKLSKKKQLSVICLLETFTIFS